MLHTAAAVRFGTVLPGRNLREAWRLRGSSPSARIRRKWSAFSDQFPETLFVDQRDAVALLPKAFDLHQLPTGVLAGGLKRVGTATHHHRGARGRCAMDGGTRNNARRDFYERIGSLSMAPLWEALHQLVPPSPAPKYVPK